MGLATFLDTRRAAVTVGLLALFVLLLPLTEAAHIVPLLLIGGSLFMRRHFKSSDDLKSYMVIALLLTLPVVIAAIDARDVEKTLIDAVRMGLYFYAGLVLLMLNAERLSVGASDWLFYSILLISLVWSFDAMVQYFIGHNLLGFEYNNRRVTGIFHPKMRIGIVLAHLLPFSIEACRRLSMRGYGAMSWLLLLPILFVVIAGGSRSSWVVALIIVCVYLLVFVWRGLLSRRLAGMTLLAVTCAALLSYQLVPQFQQRVNQTARIFEMSEESLNAATSSRGDVWASAWELFNQNRINGIGQNAFAQMTLEQELAGLGHPHAHFFGLDVLLYAGVVGFVAYMAAFLILCYRCLGSILKQRYGDFSLTLAAVVMSMPINTHWGFYSALSSSIICMLIIFSFIKTSSGEDVPE